MVMVQLVHSKQKIAVAPVPFLSLSSLSKTLLENSIFDRARVDYPTFFFQMDVCCCLHDMVL